MTVRELKARITYSEFAEWLVILQREEEWRMLQEYYWAQIAAEVCRGRVTNPGSIKTKDFLAEIKPEKKPAIPTDAAQRMERSRSAWMTACGITPKKKKRR